MIERAAIRIYITVTTSIVASRVLGKLRTSSLSPANAGERVRAGGFHRFSLNLSLSRWERGRKLMASATYSEVTW
jgi:hypothetical protein